MSMNIGIMSGVFDPVHEGHIRSALSAQNHAGLDKVYLMVEPKPRRKQAVKSFEHRHNMLSMAVADHDALGTIVINQPQFSAIDTLPLLKKRFAGADLHLIMGSDMLEHFIDWPHVESLMENMYFVVLARGADEQEVADRIVFIEKARGLQFRHQLIQSPMEHVSSTVVKSGKPDHLHPDVWAYAAKHGLYSSI